MKLITSLAVGLGLAGCVTDDPATSAGPGSSKVASASAASGETAGGASGARAGGASGESAAEREFEITRHRYSVRLREGEPLWFVNEQGDLRFRGSRDGGVHYAAVIQKLDGETRDVDFPTDQHEGGLRFAIAAPADWVGRVDASARVPPTSALNLQTRDGLIEIKSGSTEVIARSARGAIHYSGAGMIDARSERGNVHLALSAGDETRPVGKVEAGGDVELWLMSDMNVTLEARTRGTIVSNVPAGVAETLRSGENRLTLRLGSGASKLEIIARGDIVIGSTPAP